MAMDDPPSDQKGLTLKILKLNPTPSPNGENRQQSELNFSHLREVENSPASTIVSAKKHILSVARRISAQPLQIPHPRVWGVLTAVSTNARQRPQGMNILLDGDEHCLGRMVEDESFVIEGPAISAKHCKIYRDEDVDVPSNFTVLLQDTSTNGTYHNWEKLKKNAVGAKLKHGDIISFLHPPYHDGALSFVYREVCKSLCSEDGSSKRKGEEVVSASKRLKGLGIGAPEGPIYLDDVRSLQRSNMELRKQLESHVHTIETLTSESRAAVSLHENEIKLLKESLSNSYLGQVKELQRTLEVKEKELDVVSATSAERQHAVEDLNERLTASIQSRKDADEIINSQRVSISELETQLDEERNQRREEREKAAADQKAALQKAHSEAQEELKRQIDAALRLQRELREVISKLQESDKESRSLVETLRSKLEDTRESFIISEKKGRQLEAQLHEEHLASGSYKKRAEMLELDNKRLEEKLENEKLAREEAWARVSALELEIDTAIRDLSIQKQKYQGAREKVILRETQLRACYSTTEEISALLAKQQEQLKAMQKTLEDEDNDDNTSVDIDFHHLEKNIIGELARERVGHPRINLTRENVPSSIPKNGSTQSSGDTGSATQKQEEGQEEGQTQDMECTSPDPSLKAFGSDINGDGTAPVLDTDPIDTEGVIGAESQAHHTRIEEHNFCLVKCNNLAGETMQLDDEAQAQENEKHTESVEDSGSQVQLLKRLEDSEPGTIRTADLLTSEVAGSWAISTAPSVHGENESPMSGDEGGPALPSYGDGQAAGSQTPSTLSKLNHERQALNNMIGIVAPDLRDQFRVETTREEIGSVSDADTQEDSDQVDDSDDDIATADSVG
ncbi:hypothetical protein H6P81_016437 [Aristolochia fimbriata]|uniref:FHA domain-containing protein n=1 Tax=Aristolochia fimbriata TaxID=158543 RepID=A0AAV7EBI2_ARIFI|nr:hypothetical protein H6P81_016437 [Aristolochia fimbriata]